MDQSTATHRIRLGAAALNQTPLAWDTNARHIRAVLEAARDAGIGILCLPELASPATAARTCSSRPASSGRRSTCCRACCPIPRGWSPVWACRCFMTGRFTTRPRWLAMVGCSDSWRSSIWRATAFITSRAGFAAGRRASWARSRSAGGVSARRLVVRLRRRADRTRNLPRCLGRRPHRRSARAARCRRAAQSQRQPFRVRQAADSRAVRAGRLAGVLRELCVLQPARQRSGPVDLRRRHADRQRRQDAGPRTAVFVCRLAADHGRDRCRQHPPGEGRELSRSRAPRSSRREGTVEAEYRIPDGSDAVGTIAVQSGICPASPSSAGKRLRSAACQDIRPGKPVRTKRKKSSLARWRSRCSTICGRAARRVLSSR